MRIDYNDLGRREYELRIEDAEVREVLAKLLVDDYKSYLKYVAKQEREFTPAEEKLLQDFMERTIYVQDWDDDATAYFEDEVKEHFRARAQEEYDEEYAAVEYWEDIDEN